MNLIQNRKTQLIYLHQLFTTIHLHQLHILNIWKTFLAFKVLFALCLKNITAASNYYVLGIVTHENRKIKVPCVTVVISRTLICSHREASTIFKNNIYQVFHHVTSASSYNLERLHGKASKHYFKGKPSLLI